MEESIKQWVGQAENDFENAHKTLGTDLYNLSLKLMNWKMRKKKITNKKDNDFIQKYLNKIKKFINHNKSGICIQGLRGRLMNTAILI